MPNNIPSLPKQILTLLLLSIVSKLLHTLSPVTQPEFRHICFWSRPLTPWIPVEPEGAPCAPSPQLGPLSLGTEQPDASPVAEACYDTPQKPLILAMIPVLTCTIDPGQLIRAFQSALSQSERSEPLITDSRRRRRRHRGAVFLLGVWMAAAVMAVVLQRGCSLFLGDDDPGSIPRRVRE
uniref:Uncharacterized protein n=1 Tax=Knipowitschia caucasica TaxID=637954 RepID=A0AAV2J6A3_KNICA